MPTTNTPTPCQTCGGTGILDCGDGCTWAWDGETPCPACGYSLPSTCFPPRHVANWEVQEITQWQPSVYDIYEGYYAT